MRKFFLAIALVAISSTGAFACVGTTAYPETEKTLRSLNLSSPKKEALMSTIMKGKALHEQGHTTNDMSKMRESLKILDDVKSEMKQ